MAVMDFRQGGYVFSRHKVQREFAYDQGDAEGDPRMQGDRRFAADPAGADRLGTRIARLTHYMGALVSVGLMVALLAWGWQLVSRDVSGVPVIKAVAGAARTTPEEPGGELTSHTGYSVNTVAEGNEAAPAQQIAIAPGATGLAADDVAMGELGATAQDPANPTDEPLSFDGEPILPMSDSEARALAKAQAEAEAIRLALANSATSDVPASEGPVNEVVTDENGAPAQTDAITAALAQAQAAADPGMLVASTRPAPRPRVMRVASAATTATDARPVAATPAPAEAPVERPAEVASAEAPAKAPGVASMAGGPLVQIGAFDSNAIAAGEWDRLNGKFGSLFSGKGQVIQQHQSNGRTFWRLRVGGFSSIADARQFCSTMKSGGTDCIALSQ